MISFIIPTLWNSIHIYDTINSFMNSPLKMNSEIIIIDNSNSDYISPDENFIRVIKMKENIFVNPAWNLGVSLAKNRHVCLLNDDIHFNMNTFLLNFKILFFDTSLNYGMIAIDAETFKLTDSINHDNDMLELGTIHQKGNGFGMMMVIKKENYNPISDDFKIYFGDDLLWLIVDHILKLKSYYFKGLKIIGEVSVTSSKYENEYLQKEFQYWDENVRKIIKKYESS
jgi:hypothetical protein